jgi:hypothetical protein
VAAATRLLRALREGTRARERGAPLPSQVP